MQYISYMYKNEFVVADISGNSVYVHSSHRKSNISYL